MLTMDVVLLALLGEDSTRAQAGVGERLELHRPGRAPAQRFQVIQGDLLFSPVTRIAVSDTRPPVKVHGGHIATALLSATGEFRGGDTSMSEPKFCNECLRSP